MAGGASMFQSYIGPSDPLLRRSEVEGYQPVSRIGEIVVNAFGVPLRTFHAHLLRTSNASPLLRSRRA